MAEYERMVGGAEAVEPTDELYGKLLGTVGQACGFLRAQDASVGSDAWSYLERNASFFAQSSPIFRAMSLGFRLTDLWDRGETDAALELMDKEGLPPPDCADAYSLLHRLRVAASRRELGLAHEDSSSLVSRLLCLLEDQSTRGQTPWDLCLKWALHLDLENDDLLEAGSLWLGGLQPNQVAVLATSLPLLLQLGRFEDAIRHRDELTKYEGFRRHWRTERAADLAACVADRASPRFSSLRGMPWNYA